MIWILYGEFSSQTNPCLLHKMATLCMKKYICGDRKRYKMFWALKVAIFEPLNNFHYIKMFGGEVE